MIDKNKQYCTRDGREARVFMTDGGDWSFPVIAAYRDNAGRWWPLLLTKDGKAGSNLFNNDLDLIEVRPRIKSEVWVNVYRGREMDWVTVHDERKDADAARGDACIACVKLTIDVEEGEGL